MNNGYAIEARGLSKHFGDLKAVSELDLNVPRGQIYGFLGPNGSGKSTTIRMLCGLLTPTHGSAKVLDTEIPGRSGKLKPRIGYMTQKFSLFGDMMVIENLQFIAEIYSVPAKDRASRIEELHRPELLLLDEPTSAVDPQSRRDFWANLFRLAEAGTTILVSTHYMDEAERCHRLAILDHGVKVADGTPQELQASTGMHIIEVTADDPYLAQNALYCAEHIASVTQLGIRLRVLVPDRFDQPVALVRRHLDAQSVPAEVRQTTASLEDVFVAVTMGPEERAV